MKCVWMTLYASAHEWQYIRQSALRIVSGAEALSFLSALFTGRTYFPAVGAGRAIEQWSRELWTRTLRLYTYHLALLAFGILCSQTRCCRRSSGTPQPAIIYFTKPIFTLS